MVMVLVASVAIAIATTFTIYDPSFLERVAAACWMDGWSTNNPRGTASIPQLFLHVASTWPPCVNLPPKSAKILSKLLKILSKLPKI